jgi:hypothetical protein
VPFYFLDGRLVCDLFDGIEEKPLSEFSEAVQNKILRWSADEVFKSSSRLRINIEKQELEQTEEITLVEYIITLENHSDVMVSGIKLTSQVFLDQWNKETEDDDSHVYAEFLFSLDLPAGESKVFKTKWLPVRDCYVQKSTSHYGVTGHRMIPIEDRLLGMRLVVEKTGVDQKSIVRTLNEGKPPSQRRRKKYSAKKYKTIYSAGALTRITNR